MYVLCTVGGKSMKRCSLKMWRRYVYFVGRKRAFTVSRGKCGAVRKGQMVRLIDV